MFQDNQCNRVFFSALLRERCPIAFRGLTEALDKYDVPWSLLKGTNDIWCRDYMPLQVRPNSFVAYNYNPDYLQHSARIRRPSLTEKPFVRMLDFLAKTPFGGLPSMAATWSRLTVV